MILLGDHYFRGSRSTYRNVFGTFEDSISRNFQKFVIEKLIKV